MKGLGVLSTFAIIAWALVATLYFGVLPFTVVVVGFLLAFALAGCLEKPYGDAFAWIFLGVCVLLIGASFLSSITSGDSAARTLALAKSVFLLLLVLVVWLGTRQRRSQAAG